MPGELDGRMAIVTGGARGFGRAFAATLLEQGASVAILDSDAETLEQTVNALGPRALAFPVDVTDEARVNAATAEIAKVHGGIDLLINNAGLHSKEYSYPMEALGLAKVRRLFEVNVIGTTACTLAAVPYMVGRPGANIVNIASCAAYIPGAYGASKMAVISLTISFAKELADRGIRVNAIAPGLILTDTIRAELTPDDLVQINAMQFIKTLSGEERDVVEAMLYLSSDRARFITGETIRVTAGFAAGA